MQVKKVDDLGRVVLPAAMLEELGIPLLGQVEVEVRGEVIEIRLHESREQAQI